MNECRRTCVVRRLVVNVDKALRRQKRRCCSCKRDLVEPSLQLSNSDQSVHLILPFAIQLGSSEKELLSELGRDGRFVAYCRGDRRN